MGVETTVSEDRKRVDAILRSAARSGASDVHIKAGEPLLFRMEGKLRSVKGAKPLRPEDTERFVKALCAARFETPDLDTIREMDFSHSVAAAGRFRVNVFRQRATLALVIRVIPLDVPRFDELNLPDSVPPLAKEQRGLILVTGTTGSGKSTTLAAMVDEINRRRTAHVITVEDPIEFYFRNNKCSIVQREIGADTDSFPNALRAALRQDPDVIMIGEMRDTETIDIAMKAAETGHLVLSTTHTTDAAKTIQRILGVFPTTEEAMVRIRLSECLRAVVSQRLVPRQDGNGLVPAAEVMLATRFIQECIREPGRASEIPELIANGRHYGMQTFDQSLLQLVQREQITREVALSAATTPADLDLLLRLGDDSGLEVDHHNYVASSEEDERRGEATASDEDSGPEEQPAPAPAQEPLAATG